MADLVWLFSYGTLQDPAVQQSLFGRGLEMSADSLRGFRLQMVAITDPAVIATSGSDQHPMLRRAPTGGEVRGSALRLTSDELAVADRYEAEHYARVSVTLQSGRDAYVYVHRGDAPVDAAAVQLVEPDQRLLQRLLPIARRIFVDTFRHSFDAAALEGCCEEVYRPDGAMSKDFALPDVHWRVAMLDDSPIGYAKLTPLRAPAIHPASGAMELQQIYVSSEWHGQGIGDRLMNWALALARREGAPELYLTVFDHNRRAKHFYTRHGFVEVGRCSFELGGGVHDDRIWRRTLG